MRLYFPEQIIYVLLQTENILETILRNHVPINAEKNEIMKTGEGVCSKPY